MRRMRGIAIIGSILLLAAFAGPTLSRRGMHAAVAPTIDAATFSVSIEGASVVKPFEASCFWYTQNNGGTAPYTYTWTLNGAHYSNSDTFIYTNSGSPFTIGVTVVDALGHSASDQLPVGIDDPPMPCPT